MADSAVQSLRDAIDAKIAGSGPAIRENAISHFADAEQRRRVDIVVGAITAQRELEADLRKINRADQVLYAADGTVSSSAFTKGRLNDIKKATDKAAKLEAAISKALADDAKADDFEKLEKAIKAAKQKGSGGGGDTEDAEGEE